MFNTKLCDSFYNAPSITEYTVSTLFILGDENEISNKEPLQIEGEKFNSNYKAVSEIDEVSRKLLEMTNPGLLEVVMPQRTIGDGNCLFRAASHAVYGDESRHSSLRQLVFREIVEHPEWYNKDDPNFCSPFANDHEIILENFAYYCENTPKLNAWCDINHILALSAVLNTPIESYYPPIQSIVSPYSKVIIGRGVKEPDNPDTKLKIMWTCTELPEVIKDFRPNHFVPLILLPTNNREIGQGKIRQYSLFGITNILALYNLIENNKFELNFL